MTDLMEKSLITLEFPAVLALLAAQAVCDETKERIEHIRPSFDARRWRCCFERPLRPAQ